MIRRYQRTIFALFGAFMASAFVQPPVLGQSVETAETIKAYAAGYKAAFVCSATFNAGKDISSITGHELDGIYKNYREAFSQLPDAVVDQTHKRVSVTFSDSMPPRYAVWRQYLGCSQLPVGALADAGKHLPRIELDPPLHDENAPWSKQSGVNRPSGNTALDAVIDKAFSKPGFGYGDGARTSAVLVATPTEIIAERYTEGYSVHTSQRTWSVAKSIAASVIGAAVMDDYVSVAEPAPINEWQSPDDPRRNITLENLLQMASGLDSNRAGNRTDRLYFGGGRVAQTSVQTSLEVVPGSRWKYANNDTLLAVKALRAAMNDDQAFWRYPYTRLFHKIGMMDTVAEMDWGGDFVMSSQVWTTSRDLARLGILHLQDGVWNGERLLPEGWVNYISTPAPVEPATPNRRGDPVPGYGAQWWLYGAEGRFDDLPEFYAARGNRGQFLVVIPSRDMVVVRRGYDIAGIAGFDLATFVRDILAATSSEL